MSLKFRHLHQSHLSTPTSQSHWPIPTSHWPIPLTNPRRTKHQSQNHPQVDQSQVYQSQKTYKSSPATNPTIPQIIPSIPIPLPSNHPHQHPQHQSHFCGETPIPLFLGRISTNDQSQFCGETPIPRFLCSPSTNPTHVRNLELWFHNLSSQCDQETATLACVLCVLNLFTS